MKSLNVRITDHAIADMEDIYRYIAQELQVPETALHQYNRIADAIAALDSCPLRYRLFDSQPEQQRGLRLMPVDNYAVIYVATDTEVVILRVLYGKSDLIAKLRENR